MLVKPKIQPKKKNDSLRILLNRGSKSNLHMPLNAIKGLFGFLKTIIHHFSLNFYHSSLKISKFSKPHPFGTLFSLHITQIFQLFVGPIPKHLVRASLVSWFFFMGLRWEMRKKKNVWSQKLQLVGPSLCVYLQKYHHNSVSITWKHLKCVFSFHNSLLKNQRIE